MIIRISSLISLFLILVHSSAFANQTTNASTRYDHKALQQLAHDFVATQVVAPENGRTEVVANNLDPRMVDKVCQQTPEVSFASNSGLDSYTTVEIQCSAEQHWRTYVPVRIYRYKPVITAVVPMSPGHLISESDLTETEVDINRIRSNVFTDQQLLVGARVKKRVRSGQPIQASDTCLVCSGEKVTIVAKNKSLRITAVGKALADGLKGESVTVENIRSNKALEAIVTGLNEVTVQL
ncbi:flagellar basal body P-ring formation chaperone FlgA [Idiomarina seosinensis]|uniref:Flagella basal body P-ring formation protein FlgA n=1 Tax=Idiomarina seosinensis TaxID=281739 RepID=A0A432ZGB6_9GAMM|nr:flagellar basal body P-ring formation chaperone FlgA [Idiomarina seosinensis]RUO77026.1 flagella basal body P-ring formation protein FlgA [Idiomarina seosinensis]